MFDKFYCHKIRLREDWGSVLAGVGNLIAAISASATFIYAVYSYDIRENEYRAIERHQFITPKVSGVSHTSKPIEKLVTLDGIELDMNYLVEFTNSGNLGAAYRVVVLGAPYMVGEDVVPIFDDNGVVVSDTVV